MKLKSKRIRSDEELLKIEEKHFNGTAGKSLLAAGGKRRINKLPKLSNGQIDYSKIDRHNDFHLLPALYSSPEDIEKFIKDRGLSFPVLSNLLKLRREDKLNLTPTESEFYFQELFGYIYDVYKVPDEKTYKDVEKWLEHIESQIVTGGLSAVIAEAFEFATNRYRTQMDFSKIMKRVHPSTKVINYYEDIGEVKYKNYYEPNRSVLDKFWIKCSRWAGQPVTVGDESYMRVWVFEDQVYIFGCDDCSYTLYCKNDVKKREDFVRKLKCMVPVWNFNYLNSIHEELEFTN